MATPLVSICCITYNHVAYISDSIEGFLMQKTNFLYEIIINDDASTDGTTDVLLDYQRKHPNIITVITHKENEYSKGLRAMNIRNTFPRAKGQYIAMCEGDDYWQDPFKLQKQVDFLEENPEYVLAFHDAEIIDESGQIVAKSKLGGTRRCDRTQDDLAAGVMIPTLTVLFRNVIKTYPKEIYRVANGDTFLFALHAIHGKGKFLDNVESAVYRKHGGGVWSLKGRSERIDSSINTNKLLLNVIDERFRPLIRQKLLQLMLEAAYHRKGVYNTISQYFSSYEYLRLNKGSIKKFFIGHYILIKLFCSTKKQK